MGAAGRRCTRGACVEARSSCTAADGRANCAGVNEVITVEKIDLASRRVPDEVGLDPNRARGDSRGTPNENAVVLRSVLEGSRARVDCVLFNAGAALVAAGRAPTIPDGVGAGARCGQGDAIARSTG